MPVWWLVGTAIYVPVFVLALVSMVRSAEFEPGEALWGGGLFIASGIASGVFWFG